MAKQQTTLSPRSTFPVLGAVIVAAVLQFCCLAWYSGLTNRFVLNGSGSMPRGIYRVVNKPLTRGAIVGACIEGPYARLARERGYLESGPCRSGIRPVMKFIAAVPGDSVEIRLSRVLVNGESIPNTRILETDPLGRPLPNFIGTYKVQPGEYWVIANYDRGSFDSRYFGPVKEILGVVEPLLTESQLCSFYVFRLLGRC